MSFINAQLAYDDMCDEGPLEGYWEELAEMDLEDLYRELDSLREGCRLRCEDLRDEMIHGVKEEIKERKQQEESDDEND